MIKVKTFIEALNCFHSDPLKMRGYLNDYRLSSAEKTILRCWLWLRDSQFNQILDALGNMTAEAHPIIQVQKNILLGTTYNNKGECEKAIPLLKNAIKSLEDFPLHRQKLVSRTNLFIAYFNLKDNSGMEYVLALLNDFNALNESEQINIEICRLNYYSFVGEYKIAKNIISNLMTLQAFMNEYQRITFCIQQFDFAIKTDQYDVARLSLEEMKKYRKFQLSANFKFMKSLLDHLLEDATVYLYDQDFAEIPLLYFQMKVIKSLEEQNEVVAMNYWERLTELSPHIFKKDFQYAGDKCLFSMCLNKHLGQKDVAKEISCTELPKVKEDALVTLLSQSQAPLKREALFTLLWGKEVENKSDLKKLTSMVSYIRKKRKIDIKMKKGCYFLEKKIA